MDASATPANLLLTTADLAARQEFQLGEAAVSPATRLVRGPGGQAELEPRIMQVLVVLADAAGTVVTRETLFDRCWGNAYVGDDSLNRAIAGVRRVAKDVAAGSFEVETVPRTGYRLVGDVRVAERVSEEQPPVRQVSRRTIVVGALAAVAGAGGLGLWSVRSSQADRRFNELMDRADQAIDYGSPSASDSPIKYLQPAVAMRPDNAKAQGLLASALGYQAEFDPREAGLLAQRAERSARATLALDPAEPNARLALLFLQRSTLDLATNEDRLRAILATDPENMLAMRNLWGLLQSVGRSRDSFAMIERAIALKPLAAANNFPLAQLLWILGRTAEADRVIDRAMQYWPLHPWVRNARFSIYAFTGRPRAALAMLDDENTRPQTFTPAEISMRRAWLLALDQPSPATVSAARTANIEMAKRSPALAPQAILMLAVLGDVDAAFEIANELFLFRGPIVSHPQAGSARPTIKSNAWRFTPWLFTPPGRAIRADPRFNALCDGIGLTEYWAKRGIKPDYQLGIT